MHHSFAKTHKIPCMIIITNRGVNIFLLVNVGKYTSPMDLLPRWHLNYQPQPLANFSLVKSLRPTFFKLKNMSIFPGVDPCDDKVQGVFFRLSFLGLFQLGGGFKYFLFSSLFGEDFHFDLYFQRA